MNRLLSLAVLFFVFTTTQAQSTFNEVYTTLQTSCAGASCHGGGSPAAGLLLTGSEQDVYDALVGVTPTNSAAAAAGMKLIDPGYPERSFLLKKVIHNLDGAPVLDAAEGVAMPSAGSAPAIEDLEMIRQWILNGAEQTGVLFDHQVMKDYYTLGGKARVQKPDAPAANEGFQLHFGPVFLEPGQEIEYYKKHTFDWPVGQEVTNLTIEMNTESHHFILYKYNSGHGPNVDEGLRPIDNLGGVADVFSNATTVATWQFDRDHTLPEGTAYKWLGDDAIDLNYHIFNYNQDSILAAEVYVNVYTQPLGTADLEMFSNLVSYGDFNPFLLNVLNNSEDTMFVTEDFSNGSSQTEYIWLMQGHTHSLGTDYDIFRRNPDGSKGDQVYEGFFTQDYTFDQGFFDWEHPPVREFDPLLEVDRSEGLIHEATYYNDGPAPVGFGLTTKDEMFITYYQYTKAPLGTVSVEDEVETKSEVKLYPNPTTGQLVVNAGQLTAGDEIQVEVFDLLGKLHYSQAGIEQPITVVNLSQLSKGMYLVTTTIGETSSTNKIIIE